MKSKSMLSTILAIAMLSTLLIFAVPKAEAHTPTKGPNADKVRLLTIKSPDAQLLQIKAGQIDFIPGLIRPADIEDLTKNGYPVLSTPGFHMGFTGFNLKKPYLSDVNIRHALFHAYNQEEIVASIYKYTVTPVRSLVPPGQGGWLNPNLPTHPFNPGNKGDASGTMSTFGIMYAGGYVYHGTGYGDLTGYWTDSLNNRLPTWKYYTPTAEVAPTSAQHGARIVEEWHKCGFNNIIHEPTDFNTYTSSVFDDHNFDIFMIFWSLGRFPTQLYDMCHSSQYVSGSSQPVGLNDPVLDAEVETVKYSLNRTKQIEAAWAAQEHLYNEANSQALCYMLMYSRVYFNGARPELSGVINSPGYSSDNTWTWLNWNTTAGAHGNTVIYCNGEEPQTLNYLAQSTAYEAAIITPVVDALINVDPYQHRDVAWQADSWTVEGPVNLTTPGGISIVNGMKVTYNIAPDVYWQDGNLFTAAEAKFSLDFLRTNQIPNYLSATKDIAEVHVDDADTFTVYSRKTSPFFVYDWAGSANVCPSAVWKGFQGKALSQILSYDLTANGTDTGPWSGDVVEDMGPTTLLFGTGPYVFEKYDPTGMYADLHGWDAKGANLGYFKSTAAIAATIQALFHTTGDMDNSGAVWASDKNMFGLNYGKPATTEPRADLNGDGIIDWSDGAIVGAFFGWKKQYPSPLV
jgi:ABC-type transport system substrate-binding protein